MELVKKQKRRKQLKNNLRKSKMEIFKVNSCTEDGVDLTSTTQLESFLQKVKDGADIMVKWKEKRASKNW